MPRRMLARVGIAIGGIFLVAYWWIAIELFTSGHIFAYANYGGIPVGTVTVLILLLLLTPLWAWASWRFWNWNGHTSRAPE